MTEIVDTVRPASTGEAYRIVALGGLGLILFFLTVIGVSAHKVIDWNLWVLLLALSGLIAVAATMVAEKVSMGTGLAIVAPIAVATRLMVLTDDPILSTDIYRYVWDGLVQAAGINPYRYVPADPALAHLRDAFIFPNINRADYAVTIYPPVAQMFFFLATRLGETITTMRIALIGCEAVTLLVLVDLLRRLGKPATLAVAYAWHPLAVWEVANNGHVDALMVMFVVIAIWLLVRHRRIAAGVLIALGALVKPYAIVALPAFWRPYDWRLPLVVILTVAACYLPYLGAGEGVFGFLLTGYMQEEGLQGGEGFWLVHAIRAAFGNVSGLLPLYLAIAGAVLGFLALRAALSRDDSPERLTRDIALLLMTGLLFLSPNYPWYYLVAAALIPIGGGAPAWVLSIGAFSLYLLYPDYDARFLLWKGVIAIAFVIAVVVTRPTSASNKKKGLLQWTR